MLIDPLVVGPGCGFISVDLFSLVRCIIYKSDIKSINIVQICKVCRVCSVGKSGR